MEELSAAGRVFLDLKYNDIPNTVAGAARVAARYGVSLVTMHAGCGRAAMSAAAEALAHAEPGPDGARPALLAVTVLTSLGPEDLADTGPGPDDVPTRVRRLARLAWESGCDGLVCSAADLVDLRAELGPEPLAVTPGIRPAGGAVQDQKRVATPAGAFKDGADFLVVGRPITRAEDPAAAHAAIAAELEVSEATIKAHVTAIFRKMDVRSRTQAAVAARRLEYTHRRGRVQDQHFGDRAGAAD